MLPFDDVLFPGELVSVTASLSFGGTIIRRRSGVEHRQAWRSMPQRTYDLSPVTRSTVVLNALSNFLIARNMSARSFRFRDPTDHSTAADGISNPTGGPGSPVLLVAGKHRLFKRYVSGTDHHDHRITKPDAASFVLLSGMTVLTPTTHYTLDATTGIITFPGSPPADLTWTGYFDVHVRVTPSTDAGMVATLDDVSTYRANLTLEEVILEDAPTTTTGTWEAPVSLQSAITGLAEGGSYEPDRAESTGIVVAGPASYYPACLTEYQCQFVIHNPTEDPPLDFVTYANRAVTLTSPGVWDGSDGAGTYQITDMGTYFELKRWFPPFDMEGITFRGNKVTGLECPSDVTYEVHSYADGYGPMSTGSVTDDVV